MSIYIKNNNILYFFIMVNKKFKSVIINSDVHYKFKMFCKGKNLKIGAVIEDLMRLYLVQPHKLQNMIDIMKEEEK